MKERHGLDDDSKSFPEVVGDSAFLLGMLLFRARMRQASWDSFDVLAALCTVASAETSQDIVFTERFGLLLFRTCSLC